MVSINISERLSKGQREPGAVADIGACRDLGEMLIQRGGEKFAFCRGKFVLDLPEGCEAVNCAALCDAQCFNSIIDRYGARFPGADRRAVVSLWSLVYLSALTINTALAWLELRRALPISLGEIAVCLDRETAAPTAFLLRDLGEQRQLDIHEAMYPLLRQHIEPLAGAIAGNTRVSAKLLWGNAANYLDWIVEETGRQIDPALAIEGAPLLRDAAFPDGTRNPLCGTLKAMTDECGVEFKRRKVCCLRYCLNGVGGCGQTCPLPEGRH